MKMKTILFYFLFFCSGLNRLVAQAPYKLPDNFSFDYEVTQVLSGRKNVADSSVMHFFYSKTGDYAAARISSKTNMKGNLFIVLTREGNIIVLNEREKNITIINMRKLAGDFSGILKWIKMDSLMAGMHKKSDGSKLHSVKSGNTKQTGNYTSEEFTIEDGKHNKGSVWCAKVDFPVQGDYLMGAAGGGWLSMMGSQMSGHPLLQALTSPKTLVTGVSLYDSAGIKVLTMDTRSIGQVNNTVLTSGYSVSDYSAMSVPEILQSEMRRHNN